MKYDVVIVGAGMAGMTAGIYACRAGKSVLILESGAVGGQIIHAIKVANWPGEISISGADLMGKISEQVKNLGAELKYEEVMSVEKVKDGFEIITDEGKYEGGAVIIATGTEPRKLSTKQAKDAGKRPISYCAICDGALYNDKTVVVIGSGNTAQHEIKYLDGICKKVYNIHHDEPIPADAEAVFVAIGRVPATEAFKGLVDLDSDGYVVADEDCTTSCAGVFVAGDCRTKSTRQLVTAASDGAVAASATVAYLRK